MPESEQQSNSFKLRGGSLEPSSHVLNIPVRDNQIISFVYIAKVKYSDESITLNHHPNPFHALWDTGAYQTMVEPRVLSELELSPYGFERFTVVDGVVVERPVCRATIAMTDIPLTTLAEENVLSLHEVDVGVLEHDGQLGEDVDVRIGMDEISRGDFAVSQDEIGNIWCSFRHPSKGSRIDFNES